jgi:hypothetical protein
VIRTLLRISAVTVGAFALDVGSVSATPDPPSPVPIDTIVPPPVPVEGAPSSSLIVVPAGCPVPEPADIGFVGTVLDKDGYIEKGTVRFRIDQVRAGDAAPYAVNGVIDVRYGPDSQFLEREAQFLVSAAVDPEIGVLASKVSPETPYFGGDAVVGLEDTDIVCPTIDDPVQTINLDGTAVDSSLLQPFFSDKRLLLATIGVPAAIVGAALVGLVLLRRGLDIGFQGIFALGRAAVSPSPDHRVSRVRAHASESDADYSETGDGSGRSGADLIDA